MEKRYSLRPIDKTSSDAQLLLAAITDYAIYQLDVDGWVCTWNVPAQRFKGYSASEIIGRHFSCFYTEEDVARGVPVQALATALSNGKFEDEGWRVRSDGSRLWASVIINPVFDDNGVHHGFVKVTRDISEKRQAELNLQEARAAIAHLEKMQSLGRVAGGIAHDFNNLLTAILNSVDNMKLHGDDFAVDRGISAIEDATQQAAHLTSQLLAFARHQPLRPTRFSIRQSLERMLPTLQSIVGSDISINAGVVLEDCVVELDATQFHAAIINMVTNARDAISASGLIEVTASLKTSLPSIRQHPPLIGSYVALSVMDSGTGIDDKIINNIFEPFFTTKVLYQGTGLGLSQVYGFCKQSGGNVCVMNNRGPGTTITMYLPNASRKETHDDFAAKKARDYEFNNKCILLVEDNKMIGRSAVDALTDLGYDVIWLEDGKSALEALTLQPQKFDVVVSDIIMPGISGITLAKRVQKDFPHVPFILTSGYTDQLAQIESLNCQFIQKPYRLGNLVKCMDRAMQVAHPL